MGRPTALPGTSQVERLATGVVLAASEARDGACGSAVAVDVGNIFGATR